MSGRTIAFFLVAGLACASAEAREKRGTWRLSIGPAILGGVKPEMGANKSAMRSVTGFDAAASKLSQRSCSRLYSSRAEAWAAGSGVNGSRTFDDGAWYDPVDSGSELDGGYSWNWRLHDPVGTDPDGYRGFVERTSYVEESETLTIAYGQDESGSSSSEWFPGARIEASGELYGTEGERPWGVDLAIGFTYYFQRDIWEESGTAASASVDGSRKTGYFEWWNDSHDEAQYILDYYRDSGFDGEMWGSGSYSEAGPELANDGWNVREVASTGSATWSKRLTLQYNGNGDYREYGIDFIVRPWWEPWEWLRVFASVGAEVSHRTFEWSMATWCSEGTVYSESGSEDEWRLLGLLGGGVVLQWRSFFLSAEILWRLGGDDLSVSGTTVQGSVGHANCTGRLSVGYVF